MTLKCHNHFYFSLVHTSMYVILGIVQVIINVYIYVFFFFHRVVIEQAPNTYTIHHNEILLSAEIMKTMFNISLSLPEPESTDTVDHCDRIVFIVRSIFVHLKPLPDEPENLPNHAINVLSNMPTKCLKHLMWTMPSSVCKKIAQDYECRPSSQRYRIQFEVSKSHFIPILFSQTRISQQYSASKLKNCLHTHFVTLFVRKSPFYPGGLHKVISWVNNLNSQGQVLNKTVSDNRIKCSNMCSGGNPPSEFMQPATFPRAFLLHQVWTQYDLQIL